MKGSKVDNLDRVRWGRRHATDFAQRLSERLARPGQEHEQARERSNTDEHLADRLVKDWMHTTSWTQPALPARAKDDARRAALAARLRRETPMTCAWIAQRLSMGIASCVSHLTNGNPPHHRP